MLLSVKRQKCKAKGRLCVCVWLRMLQFSDTAAVRGAGGLVSSTTWPLCVIRSQVIAECGSEVSLRAGSDKYLALCQSYQCNLYLFIHQTRQKSVLFRRIMKKFTELSCVLTQVEEESNVIGDNVEPPPTSAGTLRLFGIDSFDTSIRICDRFVLLFLGLPNVVRAMSEWRTKLLKTDWLTERTNEWMNGMYILTSFHCRI